MQPEITTHPHLLNPLTSTHLQTLTSPNHPTTSIWPTIQQTMRELSSRHIAIEEALLLFNALKLIVSETFGGGSGGVNGILDNRVYCWLGMVYGGRIGDVVAMMEKLKQDVNEGNQDDTARDFGKVVCYGLLFSQIIINLAEKTNRANTTNRIIYPELYRFINLTLEHLPKPNPTTLITSHTQPQPQSQPQPQQQQQPSDPNSSPCIKTTKILQSLVSSSSIINKPKQKQQKNQQNIHKLHNSINSQIVGKIVELLVRSFGICKKGVVENLAILRHQINARLRQILDAGEQGDGDQGIKDGQTLGDIISNYLARFQLKEEDQAKEQQIDEQNKIIEVRQLTPRFAESQAGAELKKLRTKKKKLIKKLESDARTAKMNKLQQRRVLQDVRNERVAKRHKKQTFIMQKQTQQAKKQHNKQKRIKQIQKQDKTNSKSTPNKFRAVSRLNKR